MWPYYMRPFLVAMMMIDMTKHLDTIRKLRALAQRGIGGEKYNAQVKLRELMVKYGITEEQLESDKVEFVLINTDGTDMQWRLCAQIIYSVLGPDAKVSKYGGGFYVFSNRAAACEIQAKFDFYWSAFMVDCDLLLHAFINRNNIFSPDVNPVNVNDMDPENKKKAEKVLELSKQLNQKDFYRTLGQK